LPSKFYNNHSPTRLAVTMTDKLPPNLLALFAPRPPLRWVPPTDHAAEERRTANISGVAAYLPAIAAYEREYEYKPTESWLEKRDRKKEEKKAEIQQLLTEGPKKCMHQFLVPHLDYCNVLTCHTQQTTRTRTPTSAAMPSKLSSPPVSTTASRSMTWNASLAAMVQLSAYAIPLSPSILLSPS